MSPTWANSQNIPDGQAMELSKEGGVCYDETLGIDTKRAGSAYGKADINHVGEL